MWFEEVGFYERVVVNFRRIVFLYRVSVRKGFRLEVLFCIFLVVGKEGRFWVFGVFSVCKGRREKKV